LETAKETTAQPPSREFDVIDDADDTALQARILSQQMRSLARQAALSGGRQHHGRWRVLVYRRQ
jgi:hypothetical protein